MYIILQIQSVVTDDNDQSIRKYNQLIFDLKHNYMKKNKKLLDFKNYKTFEDLIKELLS